MRDPIILALFNVADGRRLELQSSPLAVSLARSHRGDRRVRHFASVSASHRAAIRDVSHAIYQVCDGELHILAGPSARELPYPHGTKMVAACDHRGTSHSIFLDTDMACTRSLSDIMDLLKDTIAAAPEERPT